MSVAQAADCTRTAVMVAAGLGVVCEDPVVLAEGMNVVVHLRPHPVVARVSRLAHLLRGAEEVRGVVGVARALAGRVVAPSSLVDAGPHVVDGRYVTFWEYLEAGPATPVEAGASLRQLHAAARGYRGTLRSFDPRPEAIRIAALVGGEAGAVLRVAGERMKAPALAEQAVHGDAHVGNARSGGVWLDLDEVCFGPPEWDLACLRHCWFLFGERASDTRDALAAYGAFDEEAVAALDPLVVLFTAAWGATAALQGQPIGARTQRRLDWLREGHGR